MAISDKQWDPECLSRKSWLNHERGDFPRDVCQAPLQNMTTAGDHRCGGHIPDVIIPGNALPLGLFKPGQAAHAPHPGCTS